MALARLQTQPTASGRIALASDLALTQVLTELRKPLGLNDFAFLKNRKSTDY